MSSQLSMEQMFQQFLSGQVAQQQTPIPPFQGVGHAVQQPAQPVQQQKETSTVQSVMQQNQPQEQHGHQQSQRSLTFPLMQQHNQSLTLQPSGQQSQQQPLSGSMMSHSMQQPVHQQQGATAQSVPQVVQHQQLLPSSTMHQSMQQQGSTSQPVRQFMHQQQAGTAPIVQQSAVSQFTGVQQQSQLGQGGTGSCGSGVGGSAFGFGFGTEGKSNGNAGVQAQTQQAHYGPVKANQHQTDRHQAAQNPYSQSNPYSHGRSAGEAVAMPSGGCFVAGSTNSTTQIGASSNFAPADMFQQFLEWQKQNAAASICTPGLNSSSIAATKLPSELAAMCATTYPSSSTSPSTDSSASVNLSGGQQLQQNGLYLASGVATPDAVSGFAQQFQAQQQRQTAQGSTDVSRGSSYEEHVYSLDACKKAGLEIGGFDASNFVGVGSIEEVLTKNKIFLHKLTPEQVASATYMGVSLGPAEITGAILAEIPDERAEFLCKRKVINEWMKKDFLAGQRKEKLHWAFCSKRQKSSFAAAFVANRVAEGLRVFMEKQLKGDGYQKCFVASMSLQLARGKECSEKQRVAFDKVLRALQIEEILVQRWGVYLMKTFVQPDIVEAYLWTEEKCPDQF
ncbi:unnamed protein product [Amoebophrya sp. A25]|nr:unnamed protein product [Amoebophrya sp. A25]|eukprot:GSA25T00005167001.1